MIKFAFKLFLFTFIFLIYDKVFITISNRSAEAEVDKRLEYLVKGEINKDIIAIGSSRGARDIIAEQIEDKTGLSAYNLCYPGSNVEFHAFILRTLVKFNDIPKVLLLVVDDDTEFFYDITIPFRKDRLYPLVKYPYIREVLADLGDKDKYLSGFLILHRLNKANFDIRKKVFTPLDTILNCGSMPVSWQASTKDRYFIAEEREYKTDNEVIEYVNSFKEIIKTCSLNKIRLIVVFPPLPRNHSESFEKRIKFLSDGDAYFYVYNTKNPIYRNQDYYQNGGHLLRKGAVIFTEELIDYLIASE